MSTPTRGLIFTPDLIPGVMAGTVTVTSRVMNPQPPGWITRMGWTCFTPAGKVSGRGNYEDQGPAEKFFLFPFRNGEKRYVKETWAPYRDAATYRAQWPDTIPPWHPENEFRKWRSSMFMPRWAARTWIEIVSVKPARCQEITEEEAIASGCRPFFDHDNPVQVKSPNGNVHPFAPLKGPLDAYAALWDQLNGKRGYPWSANCWAWRVTFRTVSP